VLVSACVRADFGWLSCFSGFSGLVLVESGGSCGSLRVDGPGTDDAVYYRFKLVERERERERKSIILS
jgi:hypothetical protein